MITELKAIKSIFFTLRRTISDTINYMLYFIKNDNKNIGIIILSSGRSGSTLLEGLLSQNDNIKSQDEILHARNKSYIPYNKIISKMKQKNYSHILFKINSFQLVEVQGIKNPKNFLEKLPRMNFIYIKRNPLEQALSNIVAYKRRKYVVNVNDNNEKEKVFTNMEEIMYWFRRVQYHHAFEKYLLNDIDYIYVDYDLELKNSKFHQKVTNKINDYLGISKHSVQIPTKKAIKNYNETFYDWESIKEKLSQNKETAEYLEFID